MANDAGKGSGTRPRLCSWEQYSDNYDRAFGKKKPKEVKLPPKTKNGYPAPKEEEEND